MILISGAGVHAAESPVFFEPVTTVYYADLKKHANAPFSFFFRNRLLSFTPL